MHTTTLTDADDTARISAGQPSFIMQEEFDRYTGYWWQPVSTTDNFWYILYEEVDERKVPQVPIVDFGLSGTVEMFTFPRAGETNATTVLKIVKIPLSACHNEANGFHTPTHLVLRSLTSNLRKVLGWHEYIVRCDWMPDGNAVS